MRTALLLAGLAAGLCHAMPAQAGDNRPEFSRWRFFGNDAKNTRSATDLWLDPATAPYLHQLWSFTTAGDVSTTPTVEGDDLYVPDWGGYIYKLNRWSGNLIWKVKLSDLTGNPASVSRTAPAVAEHVVVIGDLASGTVYALNKSNGAVAWASVADAHPAALITGPPVIAEGKVFVGVSSREEGLASYAGYVPSFRGSVVSLDLATGAMLWQFRTTPDGYTGGAVWGSPAIDRKRGLVYISTGNNYAIPPSATQCLQSGTADALGCLAPDNWFDSVVAIDLESGALRWGRRLWTGSDTYTLACSYLLAQCPNPAGPDFDFGSGPGLYSVARDGRGEGDRREQLVGIGQKSGVYWALDPDDGHTVWSTQVGPVGKTSGIVWGAAVDGQRVYVAIDNSGNLPQTLSDGSVWSAGSWAALDARSGAIIWQIKVSGIDPVTQKGGRGLGAVSVADGVMFAGSTSGDMVAIDGASGKILWSFASGGSVLGSPAIVSHGVYWGSGYGRGIGQPNNKLYGFTTN